MLFPSHQFAPHLHNPASACGMEVHIFSLPVKTAYGGRKINAARRFTVRK